MSVDYRVGPALSDRVGHDCSLPTVMAVRTASHRLGDGLQLFCATVYQIIQCHDIVYTDYTETV